MWVWVVWWCSADNVCKNCGGTARVVSLSVSLGGSSVERSTRKEARQLRGEWEPWTPWPLRTDRTRPNILTPWTYILWEPHWLDPRFAVVVRTPFQFRQTGFVFPRGSWVAHFANSLDAASTLSWRWFLRSPTKFSWGTDFEGAMGTFAGIEWDGSDSMIVLATMQHSQPQADPGVVECRAGMADADVADVITTKRHSQAGVTTDDRRWMWLPRSSTRKLTMTDAECDYHLAVLTGRWLLLRWWLPLSGTH